MKTIGRIIQLLEKKIIQPVPKFIRKGRPHNLQHPSAMLYSLFCTDHVLAAI